MGPHRQHKPANITYCFQDPAEPLVIEWRLGRVLEKEPVNDDVVDTASAPTGRRDHGGIASTDLISTAKGKSGQ